MAIYIFTRFDYSSNILLSPGFFTKKITTEISSKKLAQGKYMTARGQKKYKNSTPVF